MLPARLPTFTEIRRVVAITREIRWFCACSRADPRTAPDAVVAGTSKSPTARAHSAARVRPLFIPYSLRKGPVKATLTGCVPSLQARRRAPARLCEQVDPVHGVERGHLVRLGERRIVEDGGEEEVDRP